MAEPPPVTAQVLDRRPRPAGVVPRHIQMWLMVGLAAATLAIIVFTGQPAPTTPASTTAAPQTPVSPDRLRDYQARLQEVNERAREQQQADAILDATPATLVTPAQYPPSGSERRDPVQEDQQRRDYESLFSSNVVVSRRPELQAAAQSSADTAVDGARPSLDEVANAVARATGLSAATSGQVGEPATSATSSPAIAPAAANELPVSTAPISSSGPLHTLLEGTVIETVLTNRLDGAVAAPVNCLVTTPVFSHDGQFVLIPAGARVLGDTQPVQSFGETRLAVSFNRLLLPDGSTYRLDQFLALNNIGQAGLSDQVNQHYRSTFGAASAVGLITGLTQFLGARGVNSGNGGTVVIAGSTGDAAAQATAQTLNRFLNRLPTITIREGHRVKVYLTGDLQLPAYTLRTGEAAVPSILTPVSTGGPL